MRVLFRINPNDPTNNPQENNSKSSTQILDLNDYFLALHEKMTFYNPHRKIECVFHSKFNPNNPTNIS